FTDIKDPISFSEKRVSFNKETAILNLSPNPFTSTTTIQYCLEKSNNVKLTVFDIQGHRLFDLVEKQQMAGSHKVILKNNSLKPGVYFVKLTSGDISQIRKIVVVH
ncbi:MAG: T9SS type A sorting domain-containing protein, partial [Fibrobacteres bacterium]|nr:T9SS type A sorting domain-containing protein [Fibrobacterota bacterium]